MSVHWLASGLALALIAVSGQAARAEVPASQAAPAPAPFVAPDFAVPTLIEGPGFKLVPLGPDVVEIDYQAYMSSIPHLQQTFTRSTQWPREGITAAEAMTDMLTEQGRFQRRESFAYAVLTPDGRRELGSVYVSPSTVPGHDAEVRLWVTKADFDKGFDAKLYAWTREWIAKAWPFKTVAYPGRSFAWAEWDAMVEAGKAK